ncbi:MAG: nitroreductase family protein [Lysobacterales bacterium]
MTDFPRIPFQHPLHLTEAEALEQARRFAETMATRRTVREFSSRPVPQTLIEQAIRAAATAPSGANQQPWRFVAVSDPVLKQKIRVAAEAEEREFYTHRAPAEWLQALAPLGTDEDKPFLEIAPWLIAVFYERYSLDESGEKQKRYYPHESTGIACGLLIATLHQAGLSTLTHTPSPMGFLNELLGRPKNEMPYLLLVVGHAAADCRVPDIHRLPLDQVADFKTQGNSE